MNPYKNAFKPIGSPFMIKPIKLIVIFMKINIGTKINARPKAIRTHNERCILFLSRNINIVANIIEVNIDMLIDLLILVSTINMKA